MATDDVIKAELMHIGTAMKAHTKPFMCGIYGVCDENFGKLLGTASFVNAGSRHTLLTAGHVLAKRHTRNAQGELEYIGIAHYVRSGDSPVFVKGKMPVLPHPYDLGLADAEFPDADAQELTPQYFAVSSAGYERDVLFCHGLPDELSKPYFGVHSDTRPHTAAFEKSVFDWYDARIHVCVEWSPIEIFDETGGPGRFVKPYGMSGSLLWATGRVGCKSLDEWRPEMARVVGVLHNWDKDAHCLVGTRIEHVRTFIPQAITTLEAG